MLKCIAIDDEAKALDIIELYVNKTPFLELKGRFRDSLEALEFVKENSIDLLFLDINMPDLNGIEFLQTLSQHPMVVFTTAYSEFAVQSYDFEAVGYLLKPFTFTSFLKASNRALDLHKLLHKGEKPSDPKLGNPAKSNLVVKSGSDMFNIRLDEILFIEGAQNYVFIHTKEKKIMSLMRMKEVESKLPAELFMRIHKSFIVALNQIDKIEPYQVTIKDHEIPIGKIYKEAFLLYCKP